VGKFTAVNLHPSGFDWGKFTAVNLPDRPPPWALQDAYRRPELPAFVASEGYKNPCSAAFALRALDGLGKEDVPMRSSA